MEDSADPKHGHKELLARLRKGSFPPVAVAGAFASFVNAAMGESQSGFSKPAAASPELVQVSFPGGAPARPQLPLEYGNSLTLSSSKFKRSLAGLAVGPADRIFALGDGEVRLFHPDGTAAGQWPVPEPASCIAVDRDSKVYLGMASRVEVFDASGNRKQGFNAGNAGRPANVTAIKIANQEILVADAAARCIRRFGFDGKMLGEIGTQGKTRGFMLPNRHLDMDVNSKGVVIASDPGRHRVSSWTIEGTSLGHFGKFGLVHPEDFVGCCNPVNVALMPDGRIVTAEKVAARVKVFDSQGKLLALIGPEHFDLKCTHLHLAVDSKGRILVADPVRLEIKLFSAIVKNGGRESV